MSDNDEMMQATGYIYTHYDCPYCGAVLEFENDTKDEVLECEQCGKEFQG